MKVRQPNFKHACGISIVIPHAHNFVPTPSMQPHQIAFSKGRDAKRRGRPAADNPYDSTRHQHLHEQWISGYDHVDEA